jgi:hypothetical protein
MNKVILALAALGMVGCASAQLPANQVEQFEAQMRSAKSMAAFDEPAAGEHRAAFGMSAAKMHLALATDQAAVAKTMAGSGDPRAVMLLARAQSDADLAVGIARRSEMHRRALEATKDLVAGRLAGNP